MKPLPEITEAEYIAELDRLMVPPPKKFMDTMLFNIVNHAMKNKTHHFTWKKIHAFVVEKGLFNKSQDALWAQYKKEKELRNSK
jgi:hypothetical protein